MINNCGDFRRKKDVMFYERLEGSSSHECECDEDASSLSAADSEDNSINA